MSAGGPPWRLLLLLLRLLQTGPRLLHGSWPRGRLAG